MRNKQYVWAEIREKANRFPRTDIAGKKLKPTQIVVVSSVNWKIWKSTRYFEKYSRYFEKKEKKYSNTYVRLHNGREIMIEIT